MEAGPARDLSFDDITRLRERWDGPLAIKGVLSTQDARLAVEHGATAIILSNHGGRQFDAAPAPIDLLPAVVDAVGERAEIIVDGGIRRGVDVLKAIALGATACMIGRPYVLWPGSRRTSRRGARSADTEGRAGAKHGADGRHPDC